MTQHEIILVKRSWRLLRNINPEIIAGTFYGKLFTDKPALRRMFPKEMSLQYQKLMDMLNTIIARLENINMVDEEIMNIGISHEGYGVKEEHYVLVENAFLWTLEQGLGPDFNQELKQAWTNCYNMLAHKMMK
ncbi:MAG: hemoglobin [Crocinitomicaceae bacterium]|nr:MAG: hemoglobin [Crocinitomicaceae bacterium]